MCAYVYVVIVVRRSLVAQNLFVALSAANVWVLLSMPEEMMSRYGGALWYVCIVAVMVAGVLAQLASIGYKVAIEKDWIVVIAGKDKSQLSSELKYVAWLYYTYLLQLKVLNNDIVFINFITLKKQIIAKYLYSLLIDGNYCNFFLDA